MTTSTKQILLEKARQVDASDFVPSPCISVCRMDPATRFCEGCYRSLEEIAAWGRATEEEKRAVWDELVRRANEEDKA
jgi:predicted Fe-S protein YdhL (DUF1289 family)